MTVLPKVLAPGLRIVFCGMAVSTTSAKLGAYYARPGNKVWPTLFNSGGVSPSGALRFTTMVTAA